ncbi:hypothetical protein AB1K91_11060 [Terribacillus sp. 179-K 1B1 HS]|uniref:hypothetical protein n=1 Tax=Terribacillus sp. 179-K 1B1 HS TaxID=3142388 RepID=UPI00399F12A7
MSEPIIIAIIGAVATVTAALITKSAVTRKKNKINKNTGTFIDQSGSNNVAHSCTTINYHGTEGKNRE